MREMEFPPTPPAPLSISLTSAAAFSSGVAPAMTRSTSSKRNTLEIRASPPVARACLAATLIASVRRSAAASVWINDARRSKAPHGCADLAHRGVLNSGTQKSVEQMAENVLDFFAQGWSTA